jgi:ATP-dependent DNA helicase PIF1
MTIHKAQGQGLERLSVDLAQAFQYGQVYVALSRCTSLKGLRVFNLMQSLSKLAVHPSVVKFNETLIRQ